MPRVINTRPFQNPRSEPAAPTASKSGYDMNEESTRVATLLTVGATHMARRTTNIINGMSMYCLKGMDDWLETAGSPPPGSRSSTKNQRNDHTTNTKLEAPALRELSEYHVLVR